MGTYMSIIFPVIVYHKQYSICRYISSDYQKRKEVSSRKPTFAGPGIGDAAGTGDVAGVGAGLGDTGLLRASAADSSAPAANPATPSSPMRIEGFVSYISPVMQPQNCLRNCCFILINKDLLCR